VTYKAKTPLEKTIGKMVTGQGGPWLSKEQMDGIVAGLKEKGITEPDKKVYDDIARAVGKFLSKHMKEEGYVPIPEALVEAIKNPLERMLPWANDPEFGDTNSI
jgi:DNA-binding PadR family transcriptional regulator